MDLVENIEERTPIEVVLEIDKDGFTTVKKLYRWLELDDAHYARWVKMNILENPFAELGVDYVPIKRKRGRGRFSKDYKLTVSFAKKLATILRTGRGERARIYFAIYGRTLTRLSEEQRELHIEQVKNEAVKEALTDVILKSLQRNRKQHIGESEIFDAVNCI